MSGPDPKTGLRDLNVFRQRSFTLLFSARTFSFFGDAIVPVALSFGLLGLPGESISELGLVLATRYVAQIAFVLFGGVFADRLPRQQLMIGADITAAATQVGIAVSFIAHAVSLPTLLVLTFVNGAAAAVFQPAFRGLVPQVVNTNSLQSANAFLRLSMNMASIGGASIAGVLVAVSGPGWALLLDAATFLVSAVLLMGVRIRGGSTPRQKSTMVADVREGWKEFTARQWVWLTVAQFGIVCACFNAGIRVLGPVVAKTHLGGAPAWATILAAQSAGLVIGSAVAIRLRPRYPMRVAGYSTLGFVPCFFMLALGAPVWLAALSLLLNGVCADFFEVLWETSLQAHIPQETLSRISSYEVLGNYALGPVGLMVAGPLSDAIGVSQTLFLCGFVLAVLNISVCLTPSIRHVTARGENNAPAEVDPEVKVSAADTE
jgi:MFS family permease